MEERGAELRRSLSVDKDSPLIKSRPPRDYLEHFDAFLQEWIEETKNLEYVHYVHRSIGSLRKVKEKGGAPDPKNFLQYFDYEQCMLLFRGAEYPLEPVIKAIKKLLEEIESRTSSRQKKECQ
jgi:hypothetical protein